MTTSQNPGLSARDFRTALDIDMATKGINERELGKLLGLSQQSISKWRHRGFPPLYRVEDLKAIFGPDSNIGRMDFTLFAREVPKLRISAPTNVPEAINVPNRSHTKLVDALTTKLLGDWEESQKGHFVMSLPSKMRAGAFPDDALRAGQGIAFRTTYESDKLVLVATFAADHEAEYHMLKSALLLLAAEKLGAIKDRKMAVAMVAPERSPVTARVGTGVPESRAAAIHVIETTGVQVVICNSGQQLAQYVVENEAAE